MSRKKIDRIEDTPAASVGTANLATPPSSWWQWLSTWIWMSLLFFLLPSLAAYFTGGKSVAEKTVTAFAQPLYLALFCVAWFAMLLWKRKQYGISIGCWLLIVLLWIGSNRMLKDAFLVPWENRISSQSWDAIEPYDYVVVLGGGSGKRPDNAAQFGGAGDRIGTAARLFHRGLAKHLITTGDVLEIKSTFRGKQTDEDKPTRQTVQIWTELGIPSDLILSIGGQNTSSEMTELALHPEWWKDKRCAVITSAMHMPRAMALAKARNINLDPIPCDFRSAPLDAPLTVAELLPGQGNLVELHSLLKEWLAMQIGR